MKKIFTAIIFILFSFSWSLFAQLKISSHTNRQNYDYGEKIELYCKITNNADTTFEFLAGSYQTCQANFSFNEFKSLEHTACLTLSELLEFKPHTSLIYKWIIDPMKTGLPNNEGKQEIICKYYFDLADTIFIDAPQYLGGQLSVGYLLENTDLIQIIKENLNVILIHKHNYNDIVNELWQVEGFQIDSLINKYKNDILFTFFENPAFIIYDSIYSVYTASSLDFYPIHIGDKWLYDVDRIDYEPNFYQVHTNYNLTREIIRDTVLANNKKYFEIKSSRSDSNSSNYFYERIDSLNGKVYQFDETFGADKEFLIVDLTLENNQYFTTWIKYRDELDETKVYLKDISEQQIFDQSLTKLSKIYEYSQAYYSEYFLSKDIGKTYQFKTIIDGFDEYQNLKSAFINGAIYGDTTIVGVEKNNSESIPTLFSLSQNYPNPFNPSTTIEYTIPTSSPLFKERTEVRSGFVSLIVYDILGREVATLINQAQKPGNYKTVWDATNFSSGIYYYSLITNGKIFSKKMILLK